MYRKYKKLLNSYSKSGYPDYGEDLADKSKTHSYDAATVFKAYCYGNERKKPHFWERDEEINKNFLLKWKKKALQDSKFYYCF